jgi:cytochrome c551/c552
MARMNRASLSSSSCGERSSDASTQSPAASVMRMQYIRVWMSRRSSIARSARSTRPGGVLHWTRRASGYSAPAMLKVLIAAVVGTVVGIVVMVVVIVAAGTTTDNSSSVGLGALPVTTQTPGNPSTSSSSTSSSSTGGSTSTGGGNAANGKAVFTGSSGCSGCHTFTAAGATGTVGPNLDSLSSDAQKAGQPLDQFVMTSITDPNKFIAPGFSAGTMPTTFGTTLSQSDLADLVAFITQNQK